MAIGYRAILSAESTKANLDSTFRVLRDWVTSKDFTTLPDEDNPLTNPAGAQLVAAQVVDTERNVRAYRWTLTEEWAPPKWYENTATSRTGVTRINLIISSGVLWLWVDIEPPTLEYQDNTGRLRSEPQPSGTPRFVSEILEQVDLHDGIERPTADVQLVTKETQVERLLQVLADPDRRGSVYVSSTSSEASEPHWLKKTKDILGRIEGMGFGYLLTSEVQELFNQRVGYWHSVPRGAMRTFLPGADFDDPGDGFRHRLLHASTIEQSKNARLQRIIRNAQIERLRNAPLPDALRDADYAFLRRRRELPFDILHQPATAEAREDSATLLERLRDAESLLDLALEENAKLLRSEQDAREAADISDRENQELYTDITDTRDKLEQRDREIEFLRSRLKELGGEGSIAAYGFVDQDATNDRPATFSELIDKCAELSGIQYFGDRADAEELDEFSDLGPAAVSKAWDALTTFDAYARARESGDYNHSLRRYCDHTDHGLPMRAKSIVWGESHSVRTNSQMAAQREVSGLPPSISESGRKVLLAHIRLATHRGGSPRLYFDDTVAKAGFVTVGYIGIHLRNTLTN